MKKSQTEVCDISLERSFSELLEYVTRKSSGDEIANVNFLYDDIVHVLKIQ